MNLKLRSFLFTLLTTHLCYGAETTVSIAEISKLYQKSQMAFVEASKTDSIEGLFRALTLAGGSLTEAREKMRVHKSANQAEEKMKGLMTASLMEDVKFMTNLKQELGLGEVDSIETYRNLRLSLLKDPARVQDVIKMDLQIKKTVRSRPLTKFFLTTR